MRDAEAAASVIASELLGGLDVGAFIDEFLGRRPRPVRQAVAGDDILTVDEVDNMLRIPGAFDLLEVSAIPPATFDAVRLHGLTDLFEAAERSDGLIVVGLERLLADTHPLIACLRSLEHQCRMPTRGITVFISAQGATLPIHHDVYEVFTLQLAGSKRWELFQTVPPHQRPADAYGVTHSTEPVVDVLLEPGDLLYMPKGQVHRVTPGDGLSLSVAMTYEPQSWFSLLDAVIAEVRHDERFWRTISPRGIADGVEARRSALIDAVRRIDADAFADRIEAEWAASIPGLATTALADAFEIGELQLDTVMRRPVEPELKVVVAGGAVTLFHPYGQGIRLPASCEHAARFVVGATAGFRVADVCDDLPDAAKIELLRTLARHGIVQRVPAPPLTLG